MDRGNLTNHVLHITEDPILFKGNRTSNGLFMGKDLILVKGNRANHDLRIVKIQIRDKGSIINHVPHITEGLIPFRDSQISHVLPTNRDRLQIKDNRTNRDLHTVALLPFQCSRTNKINRVQRIEDLVPVKHPRDQQAPLTAVLLPVLPRTRRVLRTKTTLVPVLALVHGLVLVAVHEMLDPLDVRAIGRKADSRAHNQ